MTEVADLARERDMRSLVLVRCKECNRPMGAIMEGAQVRCPHCRVWTVARKDGATRGRR